MIGKSLVKIVGFSPIKILDHGSVPNQKEKNSITNLF